MKNNEHNVIPFIQRILNDAEVEWKPLDNVAELKRGTSITKRTSIEGKYPVISGGQQPAYYIDTFNRDGETITVAGSGAYAGFVMYWNEPIFVSDAFSIKADETQILPRYIYHFLLNIQEKIHDLKAGGGVPHVYAKDVARFLIPIPCPNNSTKSLEIQRKIVDILDKFTTLETELETELVCRKRQYEYYRNRLLSFDMLNRGGQKLNNVVWKKIGEVFELRNGYTPSKANTNFWTNGTIPWFRMEDIRTNGSILNDSILHITPQAIRGKGLFKSGSIIMATTATIGKHALLMTDSLANQQFTNFRVSKSLSDALLPKFIYYYFFIVDEWCKQNVNVSSFPSVEIERLKKQLFPIPPLSEQERIVSILDKFDSLTNSISEGLPKEIELRRKQYEYYRNELLSFSRIWTHEPCVPTL